MGSKWVKHGWIAGVLWVIYGLILIVIVVWFDGELRRLRRHTSQLFHVAWKYVPGAKEDAHTTDS